LSGGNLNHVSALSRVPSYEGREEELYKDDVTNHALVCKPKTSPIMINEEITSLRKVLEVAATSPGNLKRFQAAGLLENNTSVLVDD
jgi:hypothetical protein